MFTYVSLLCDLFLCTFCIEIWQSRPMLRCCKPLAEGRQNMAPRVGDYIRIVQACKRKEGLARLHVCTCGRGCVYKCVSERAPSSLSLPTPPRLFLSHHVTHIMIICKRRTSKAKANIEPQCSRHFAISLALGVEPGGIMPGLQGRQRER